MDGDFQVHPAVFEVVDFQEGYPVGKTRLESQAVAVKTHPHQPQQNHSQVGGGGPGLPRGRFPKDDALVARFLHSPVGFP